MDKNTNLKKAKNKIKKKILKHIFFELMNNAVFGNPMKNVRNM